ncbi:UNVERIFIED_CONTAM: hypothetical protein Sradi_5293100 [Sesamum radiatum]|uniref:Transposase-associated domain-containing protein n=1 Tax=Sesamum radiatum TaxID=300843 RepID=A0AAW2LQ79_SESRA
MYEKNLLNRASLTPEFEDYVTAFIEWAKSQHVYMSGEKIRCPCGKCRNKVFKTPDEDEQTTLAPAEEGSSTHCGDATQMNWAQMMIFYAAGSVFWSSTYNQDGDPDDGTRLCPIYAGSCSYYYGRGPYDYVSRLADRFYDVLHAAEQPLWNGCAQSQLGVVARLVDIKDDIDLEYLKFCGEARYLPLTLSLQRLYASQATAEQMTWHANHQMEGRSMCPRLMRRRGGIFIRHTPILQRNHVMFRLSLCINGFAPHRQYGRTYSCWTIILTPYNLPPRMCISSEYMFLTMVIPGPSNLKRLIEEQMTDMMVMMREMQTSSSIVGLSQPTTFSTTPAQPTIDPQPPNDDEMGGLD